MDEPGETSVTFVTWAYVHMKPVDPFGKSERAEGSQNSFLPQRTRRQIQNGEWRIVNGEFNSKFLIHYPLFAVSSASAAVNKLALVVSNTVTLHERKLLPCLSCSLRRDLNRADLRVLDLRRKCDLDLAVGHLDGDALHIRPAEPARLDPRVEVLEFFSLHVE